MSVVGAATFSNTLSVANSLTVSGDLNVSGAVNYTGTGLASIIPSTNNSTI